MGRYNEKYEEHKEKEQKFIPIFYNGAWNYNSKLMNDRECSKYFEKNNVYKYKYYTMQLPYNCEKCPNIMKKIYIKYILLNKPLIEKE